MGRFRAWRALGERLVYRLNRKILYGGGNVVDGSARSNKLGVHAQTCVFLEAGEVVALARHDLYVMFLFIRECVFVEENRVIS